MFMDDISRDELDALLDDSNEIDESLIGVGEQGNFEIELTSSVGLAEQEKITKLEDLVRKLGFSFQATLSNKLGSKVVLEKVIVDRILGFNSQDAEKSLTYRSNLDSKGLYTFYKIESVQALVSYLMDEDIVSDSLEETHYVTMKEVTEDLVESYKTFFSNDTIGGAERLEEFSDRIKEDFKGYIFVPKLYFKFGEAKKEIVIVQYLDWDEIMTTLDNVDSLLDDSLDENTTLDNVDSLLDDSLDENTLENNIPLNDFFSENSGQNTHVGGDDPFRDIQKENMNDNNTSLDLNSLLGDTGAGSANTSNLIKDGSATVAPVGFAPISPSDEAASEDLDSGREIKVPANFKLLFDVKMKLTVELGRSKRKIKEILRFGEGSIVELDKLAGEPVDVFVNGYRIAKGEVVVIDDNFGVRITDILAPYERMESIKQGKLSV